MQFSEMNVFEQFGFTFVDDVLYLTHRKIKFFGKRLKTDPVKPSAFYYLSVAFMEDPFVN